MISMFSCHNAETITKAESGIIVSKIKNQKVFAKTHSTAGITIACGDCKNISLQLIEKPDYVSIEKMSNYEYNFSIEAPQTSGTHDLVKYKISIDDREKTKNDNEATTIILQGGDYGKLELKNLRNLRLLTSAKSKVNFDVIHIYNCSNVLVKGCDIGRKNEAKGKISEIVSIDSISQNIKISNCIIRSSDNVKEWGKTAWYDYACRGISVYGDNNTIESNIIENVFHAVETSGDKNKVENNIIRVFSGDGLRNTGNYNSVVDNMIYNAVVDDYDEPNGNHDDLYQSWTFDKPIIGTVIKGNIGINCLTKDLKLKSRVVQGIACFDGFVKNWQVENNIVIIDHPHGIALYGVKNCSVNKNLVLKNPFNLFQFESLPWIMINDHKDGRKSENNSLKNNISNKYIIKDTKIDSSNNISIPNFQQLKGYENWDFRLE